MNAWSYRSPARSGGLRYISESIIEVRSGGTAIPVPPVVVPIDVVMRFPPLFHPLLHTALPTHWPSICTVQLVTYTITASRQQIPVGGSNIAGMVNVQCRLGPIIFDRPTDNEIRTAAVTEQYVRRQLKLNGYFPQIVPRLHRVIVDGVVYPIRGVEEDSEHFSTRLTLEVVRPHG